MTKCPKCQRNMFGASPDDDREHCNNCKIFVCPDGTIEPFDKMVDGIYRKDLEAARDVLDEKLGKKDAIPLMTSERMVDHPDHYTVGGVEVIEIQKAKLSPEGFRGYLLGCVIKYVLRAGHKSDEELTDYRKAQWYLARLIREMEP